MLDKVDKANITNRALYFGANVINQAESGICCYTIVLRYWGATIYVMICDFKQSKDNFLVFKIFKKHFKIVLSPIFKLIYIVFFI